MSVFFSDAIRLRRGMDPSLRWDDEKGIIPSA